MGPVDAPARIETDRLVLSRLVADDATALAPVMTDEDAAVVRDRMGWDAVDDDAVREYAADYERRWETGECAAYLVRVAGDDRPAGSGFVYLEHGERIADGRAEIGLWLHPDHWDRGLGAELADALTRVALDDLGCVGVDAATDPDNRRAARMLGDWVERHGGEERGVVVGAEGALERRYAVDG